MLKVNLSEISGKNIKINFSLENNNNLFTPDRENNLFIDQTVNNSINNYVDNELIFFYPQTATEIIFKLYNSNGNNLFYSDLGFINDDITFLSNRFINSIFRINFYDDQNLSSRNLVHQINLPYQLNEYQRDNSGELPNDVSAIKVIYQIKKNNYDRYESINTNGYNILLPVAQPLFTYPKQIYAEYLFLNASNGDIIRFMPTNNYNQNNYYSFITLKYIFSISQSNNYYSINNNYGNISFENNKMIISLYKIKF